MEASEALNYTVVDERPRTVIEPTKGWAALRLKELWQYREVGVFLAVRDVKIRYRQTAFGALWVVVQPLALMVVLAVVFGVILKVGDQGVPYPLFLFSALTPWSLFAQSLNAGALSMILNEQLISKIYFPRLLLPFAAASSFLLDFCVSLVLLVGMLIFYGQSPSPAVLLLPLFVLLCLLTSIAAGTVLAAVNVRYRDIQSGLPLLTQIWLFASPIVYSIDQIHNPVLRDLYGINPMATVISGFRWALIGAQAPPPGMVAFSLASVTLLGFVALVYFRRTERTFADVI
jgi:lipopolysaccharide transport system permease protein